MFKANDFDRDGCRTFIVQFPCRKMKSFLFAQIISEKNCFQTLRSTILHLFLFSDNPQTILKPLHRQSFLPASITAQKIFLSYSSFYVSALAFSLLQIQHKPSSLLVLIPTQTIFPTYFNPKCPRQAILDTSATFHLSVFIPVKMSSRYMTTKFCSFLCNKSTALGDRQQFFPRSLSIKKNCSSVLLLFQFSEIFLQATQNFKLTTQMFAFNIQEVQ